MARESKSEQVYVQLKQDILNGTLSPGQSLSAIDVGTRFSASRTPVRQAFLRLEADGLVSLTDRQGHGSLPSPSRVFGTCSSYASCSRRPRRAWSPRPSAGTPRPGSNSTR